MTPVPVGERTTVIGNPTGDPKPYVVTGSFAGLSPNRVAYVDGDGVAAHVATGMLVPFVDDTDVADAGPVADLGLPPTGNDHAVAAGGAVGSEPAPTVPETLPLTGVPTPADAAPATSEPGGRKPGGRSRATTTRKDD